MAESNRKASRKRPQFSEETIQDCLRTLQSGQIEDLFEIIPRIGVIRDPRFRKPLLDLLRESDPKRREFAAYAMGALGEDDFVVPLKEAFHVARGQKGRGAEEVQIAIIEAIGVIGDDAAAEFFLPILQSAGADRSSKLPKWIVESLGAVAQQGGERSLRALLELTGHPDAEVRAQAISELSVAYWHRPRHIPDETLTRIFELTRDRVPTVAESAVSALQSLADVGCKRAEKLFGSQPRP